MSADDELAKKRLQLSTDTELKAYRETPEFSKAQLNNQREEQRKFGLGSDSGQYAAHVYQVFNDPDFDRDISNLREQFEKMYYPDISLATDYMDNHLLLEDKAIIKALADKYCISLDDLGIYADCFYHAGSEFGRRIFEYGGFMPSNPTYREIMPFYYALGPRTTLQQIANDWDFIQESIGAVYGGVNSKSKSPENPQLIYAVYKARAAGLTFTKIFRQYQDNELSGYIGKNTEQYSSKDSLERYYRKYEPRPQGDNIEDYNDLKTPRLLRRKTDT